LAGSTPASAYHAAGPSLSLGAALQAKVAVGHAGDAYEREADDVSEQVRGGRSVTGISPVTPGALQPLLQRQQPEEPPEREDRRDAAEPLESETATIAPLMQRATVDEATDREEEAPEAAEPAQMLVQRQAGDGQAEPEEPDPTEPEEPEPAQTLAQRAADIEPNTGDEQEGALGDELVQPCGSNSCSCSPAEHAAKDGGGSDAVVQAAGDAASAPAADSPDVGGALHGPRGGEPLRSTVREPLEESTGYDLADVRVHQGGLAQGANRALHARAFTHGQDIWLGSGESPDDLKLMAHESTHIVQQSGLRGGLQLIQRAPADYRHPEDGGGIRSRLDRRFAEIDRSQAPEAEAGASTATADGRRSARRIDRGELRSRSAELGGATRPDVDRPGQEAPRIESAAATVDREALTPPEPLVPGEPTAEPKGPTEERPRDVAQQAAARAAGAYGAADAQPEPGSEAEVQAPEPVSEPTDATGEGLDPDPESDDQVASLAARAQSLRERGTLLRAQAAEAHANADIMRGNIAKVSGEVTKAEEGIGKAKQHTTYRREVVGQTDQALGVSREKQSKVASEAPGFQSKADEGKADSGPMAGEARSLAADNAANAPDDDEAAAKSREQGGKITQVGNDAGTMDDAVSQTRTKADSLQQDAARASELNTQTQTNVTTSRAKLDEVGARLTQHTTETGEARGQVTALGSAPAALHAQANNLDAAGQQVIASSYELEASLHETQGAFAEQISSVPGIEPYEGEVPQNVDPSSSEARAAAEAGVLAPDFADAAEGAGDVSGATAGAAPIEESGIGEEEAVQRTPDETAPVASAPSTGSSSASTSAATPLPGGAEPAVFATSSGPTAVPARAVAPVGTPALSPAGTDGILPGAPAPGAVEPEAGEATSPREAESGEEGEAEVKPGREGAVPEVAGAGPEPAAGGGAEGEGGIEEPAPELETEPEPTEGRQQVDAMASLPGWLTGVEPQSAAQRGEAEDQANQTRREELNRINELAGGRMVSELSAGERLGIAGRLVLGRYASSVKGIKWPGWGGLAKMLLDPRTMLTGAVGGLQMILSGGANLFSAAQWQRDPLGNLLKSGADIATGLAIILASITALAALVAAIMGALIIITFGAASPIAVPVISVCTTIITTVGGWTIAVGKVALVLQALSLIKNLIDAATAQTAEELQREAGEIQSDINGGAQAVMSIAGAKGSMAGIRNVRNRVAGVIRGARRAGGARALARATAGAAMRRGRSASGAVGRVAQRGARAVGRGAVAVGRGAAAVGRGVVAGGRAAARTVRSTGERIGQGARAVGARVRRALGIGRAGAEARELARLGPISRETRDMLRANPTLREALARNPRAASILKRCNTPCFPPSATTAQIERMEALLERARRAGDRVDMDALRNALHAGRGDLDRVINRFQRELEAGPFRSALTGEVATEFVEAAGRGVARVESELPVLTRGGAHLLVGAERHHPVFRMFLRAFDKMGIREVRTASGRFISQRPRLVDLSTNLHRALLHELWDTMYPKLARPKPGQVVSQSTLIAKRLGRNARQMARRRGIGLAEARRVQARRVLDKLSDFYEIALRDTDHLVAVRTVIASLRRRSGL
jgi:hypothetical protein